MSDRAILINGDCLEILRELEDNSVDSLITDPPLQVYPSWVKLGIRTKAAARQGADHEAAVLAVISHFFEECDIFERITEAVSGDIT